MSNVGASPQQPRAIPSGVFGTIAFHMALWWCANSLCSNHVPYELVLHHRNMSQSLRPPPISHFFWSAVHAFGGRQSVLRPKRSPGKAVRHSSPPIFVRVGGPAKAKALWATQRPLPRPAVVSNSTETPGPTPSNCDGAMSAPTTYGQSPCSRASQSSSARCSVIARSAGVLEGVGGPEGAWVTRNVVGRGGGQALRRGPVAAVLVV
jgi:hypothetical protein